LEGEKKGADVTSSDRRRVIIDGRMPLANADDLRVEAIAAQLEEAEQQRLLDHGIEEQSTSPTTGSKSSSPLPTTQLKERRP
jgi:hypothetical protein